MWETGFMSIFKRMFAIFTTVMLLFSGIRIASIDTEKDQVKNVILMIGDGMGENHLDMTEAEEGVALAVKSMPLKGYAETIDFFGITADSASAGTALACGVRTISGMIGVYPSDPGAVYSYPANLAETAISKGMKTGVVTSDYNSGATPACFSSHTASRASEAEITKQQLASGIDLIWSGKTSYATDGDIAASAFERITTKAEMDALAPGSKTFGQFSGELWALENANGPTLTEMALKAVELLEGENGFFLMIEGAHIDKLSHDNNAEKTKEAVIAFDSAVAAMLDYAENDGNTLVVVTADHETGGVKYQNGKFEFTSTGHTRANVPVYVYGSENFIKEGRNVINKEIAIYIAFSMGFSKTEFPKSILK
ncbi:MAG: alkaline phosphatase [Oscillospiraceae bacterium]|nr:alkaline phosphatase [Oscillospiraceae bacterium]